MIDTHCHLNFAAFKDDVPQVIERAKARGVTQIIIPGTDLASSERAISIAQSSRNCWAAVGIHPHHSKDVSLVVNDDLRKKLRQLLQQKRVVAVGEIGIDYHQYRKTKYGPIEITPEMKQKQKDLFVMQMELARDLSLPMSLHCRDAHEDMIQIISSFASNFAKASSDKKATADKSEFNDQTISSASLTNRSEAKSVKINSRKREISTLSGVFHCFGGSKKHLRLLITMGYYIGFDGNITYSEDWGTFVRSTPLDRLLLETDSPYLTPVPHRNERNEPQHIPLIAEAVAKYHQVPVAKVIHLSTMNAHKLFKI